MIRILNLLCVREYKKNLAAPLCEIPNGSGMRLFGADLAFESCSSPVCISLIRLLGRIYDEQPDLSAHSIRFIISRNMVRIFSQKDDDVQAELLNFFIKLSREDQQKIGEQIAAYEAEH
jgi:hypothetical protein